MHQRSFRQNLSLFSVQYREYSHDMMLKEFGTHLNSVIVWDGSDLRMVGPHVV